MSSGPAAVATTVITALVLGALGVAAPRPASAQTPSNEAPETVARAAMTALAEARWGDVADLVHPAALERMRSGALRAARAEERHRDTEWRPDYSDMPEEVAKWFEEQARQSVAEYGSPLERLYGVASIEELEALSPREFFSRWLEANDPMVQILATLPEEERGALEFPGAAEHFRGEREVVGSVLENDSVALVVYRARTGPAETALREAPGVLTLRRVAERWAVWPTDQATSLFGISPFVMLSASPVDPAAVAERVVVWPDEEAPVGRAYVVGYTGEDEPPRGLAVEVEDGDGEPIRVEIPVAAFADLLEILTHWAHH